MDHVSDADLPALAKSGTVATLLPAANYFLGLDRFPLEAVDADVAVALATDYDPGTSPTLSMPFVLSATCTHMNMAPAEAITAATINGACALNLQHKKGVAGTRQRCGYCRLRRCGLSRTGLLVWGEPLPAGVSERPWLLTLGSRPPGQNVYDLW